MILGLTGCGNLMKRSNQLSNESKIPDIFLQPCENPMIALGSLPSDILKAHVKNMELYSRCKTDHQFLIDIIRNRQESK